MGVERAATALRPGDVHVVAVGGEDACGRRVDVSEDDALHAACDKCDAGARAREMHGRPGRAQPRRRNLTEWAQRAGRGQTAKQQCRAEAPAVREDVEDEAPQQPLADPTSTLRLDVGAGRFDQAVVLHSRRAGRHARHAAEAAIEVLDDRVGELE